MYVKQILINQVFSYFKNKDNQQVGQKILTRLIATRNLITIVKMDQS